MPDPVDFSQGTPPKRFALPGLKSFLPLSEDTSFSSSSLTSTRGQTLPGLLSARSRSHNNLVTLRREALESSPGRDSHRGRRDGSPGYKYADGTRDTDGDTDGEGDVDLEAGHGGGRKRRRPGLSGDTDQPRKASWVNWSSSDAHNKDRRMSVGAQVLMTPQMRSQRLIGNSNPRYKWEQYYKSDEELKKMKKSVRKYYERNNMLIQQYMYIDRLLDSTLPHSLIEEYDRVQLEYARAGAGGGRAVEVPETIEEAVGVESAPQSPEMTGSQESAKTLTVGSGEGSEGGKWPNLRSGEVTPPHGTKIKRTPKNLYKVPDEDTPLLTVRESADSDEEGEVKPIMPKFDPEEDEDQGSRVVTVAIYINFAANTALLIMKIIVAVLTSSLSVLASLVDAALDFLSTAIVWTTTRLISQQDQYKYPVGRRRLEPIGVLVFSVIMITSFFQVALEGMQRLTSDDHRIVQLTIPAIAIMASTVVIKFLCWLWCRFIRNSSVQALAQDAMTDVVFNIFSIIFPLIGFYARVWWLDALGGILLSLYVIINWSRTSAGHIRNLTGAAATADERNILLYLTMRFAKTIKQIQGLQAYHAGDKLNVEVDIVLDEATSLRDSHDLGESLQYVLESVPMVDRAFVHMDYSGWNLPSHMQQQD